MSRFTRSAAAVLLIVHMQGCYAYHEVPPSSIRDGSTVRVMIQAEEAVRQQSLLGRLTQTLEGEVIPGQPGGTLGLTVPQTTSASTTGESLNVFVSVPFSTILRAEEKRFSLERTLLMGGIGVGLVAGALAITTGGTDGGGEDGGTDARVRVPLIRIPFR